MTLTVLGSGTMLPTRGRFPAAYLLEHAGMRLLLDCGHTATAQLAQRRVDFHAIATVCITHFHTDHFGGLLPFVHARWVDDVQRQRPHRPLTVLGPGTLVRRFRALRSVFWPEPTESYPTTFLEGARQTQIGPFRVAAFPVQHVPWFPALAFRISVGDRSLVYTGDLGSRQAPPFERALRGASALLIEAGALRPAPNHYTAQQAIALARRCGIPRVYLTHVRAGAVSAVRRAIRGRRGVRLVSDGDRIRI